MAVIGYFKPSILERLIAVARVVYSAPIK